MLELSSNRSNGCSAVVHGFNDYGEVFSSAPPHVDQRASEPRLKMIKLSSDPL
jgi:hypothetical protein